MFKKTIKKKRKYRLIRFVATVFLGVLIGFLIFYNIDNPGFLRSLFDRGEARDAENARIETEIENVKEEVPTESPGESTDPGGLSLWQRIMAFFERGSDKPESGESYPAMLSINIYFARTGQEKNLAAEERRIIAGNPGNALSNAMKELLRGPLMSYYFPVIPAGTRLVGSRVSDGVAEVDLSQEFLENSLDTRILDEYIIYSIVNTVTGIPDINGVIFFMEGKRIKMYGNIDLSIPVIRNADLLIEEQ
ncbi:MAG: GerMN domain-containing protein [Actinomycetia bacterium]|nr:GerMN domain-containing protein [Actinomycetes bacterium]